MFRRRFFRGPCKHFLIPGILSKFRYGGPCRCGCGPHAFYLDETGRLAHARGLLLEEIEEGDREKYLEEVIKYLKEELKILEEELKKIKKKKE
ncbi:MAG TPA: hypothetical protein EYH15_00860 [Methanothermococcus okinawensis]|uniref:Uncharacterized protein n=1 Tax=Methanothermococcus okinawensis TaxID=155863 RepID=A0A832ZGL0_9EURY|nr:hypothetical protein [Methanococcaceae archaeon]HIP84035.1 hypothetical protein [Methanothermococcus okinawensis]HIP91059.1 hypothetical protein [Methanothermococcus okinawensis]